MPDDTLIDTLPDPQADYGAGGPYDFDEIDEAIHTDFDNWFEQFQRGD